LSTIVTQIDISYKIKLVVAFKLVLLHKKVMPKKTDQNVIVRSYQLRQGGLTLDAIMARLGQEFAAEVIPNRSTISRRLKSPPKELAEDVPFEWGKLPRGVPYSQGRLLLDILAYLETFGYGFLFTQRVAKWAFRVIQAVKQEERRLFVPRGDGEDWYARDVNPEGGVIDSPTESDLIFVALEYSWRETADAVLNESFNTRDLDNWIAFMPWKGLDWLTRYKAIQDSRGFPPVRWHVKDADWLSKVAPQVASAFDVRPAPTNPLSEVDEAQLALWKWATDGLLSSQMYHYRAVRGMIGDQSILLPRPDIEPWYFEYLDQIARDAPGGSDGEVD